MADSNITVSALSIAPGIGHNLAQWSFSDPNEKGLSYLQLAAVELWAASSNNRSLATKAGEARDNVAHLGLGLSQTWYYWIRARNKSGLYGDWYPEGATSGVQGTTASFDDAGWQNYTPTVAALSGTLTSVSSTGRYKFVGRTVLFSASCLITTNGTGAGAIKLGLPVAEGPIGDLLVPAAIFSGGSTFVGGVGVFRFNDYVEVRKYDGTYPGGNLYSVYISGAYERAV
jgi:hypothetical protein